MIVNDADIEEEKDPDGVEIQISEEHNMSPGTVVDPLALSPQQPEVWDEDATDEG